MTHITLPRATVQQAIDAMDKGYMGRNHAAYEAAITALRTALAAPPNPPHECKTEAEKIAFAFGWWKALEVNRAAVPAAQKVEPTDCGCATQLDCDGRCCMKVAPAAQKGCDMGAMCLDCQPRGPNGECPDQAAPAAREPLTVEEIDALTYKYFGTDLVNPYAYARAIEAAHGIGRGKKVVSEGGKWQPVGWVMNDAGTVAWLKDVPPEGVDLFVKEQKDD